MEYLVWLRSSLVGLGVGLLLTMGVLFAVSLLVTLNAKKEYLGRAQKFLQITLAGVFISLAFLVIVVSAQAGAGR
ncbi:MAG TPA: hypothetical protein VGE59_04805 [Patescibacteria group bacterium]